MHASQELRNNSPLAPRLRLPDCPAESGLPATRQITEGTPTLERKAQTQSKGGSLMRKHRASSVPDCSGGWRGAWRGLIHTVSQFRWLGNY
ncbi:hypothetical protein CapIbe_009704 [Capra ibex]